MVAFVYSSRKYKLISSNKVDTKAKTFGGGGEVHYVDYGDSHRCVHIVNILNMCNLF